MTAPSLTKSKFVLMHAALAYISPELSTLNDIIQRGHNPAPTPWNSFIPSTSRTTLPRLPTEILLLIREWLVPEVTAARQIQSLNALRAYERALHDLLCEDCVLYNLDIYGSNIWEWEQFTSACSCREPGVPKGYRSSTAPSERRTGAAKLRDGCDSISVSPPAASTDVNPKQFLDAEHWLEWHLSREAALCVGYRGHEASSPSDNNASAISDSASEATTPACTAPAIDIDIWQVVASVLRELKCEAVREPDDAMSARQRAARREQFRIPSRDYVRIVPQRTQEESSSVDSEQLEPEREWDMQRRLHRAHRELGLWSDYPDMFSEYLFCNSAPPPRPLRDCFGIGRPNSYFNGRDFIILTDLIDTLQSLLRVSLAISAGLVSAPLTLTTFALTVLCYYSRPKSFRLL
jgi:hypothetical protein